MVKIVRKLAATLSHREDRDCRDRRSGFFVNAIDAERMHMENISRAWRLR